MGRKKRIELLECSNESESITGPQQNKQVVSKQQTTSVATKQPTIDAAGTSQPRYQTSADYAMKEIPLSYFLENATPITISSPKKWADLVEEEEKETQLAQTMNTSWTEEDFKNWRQLMGLKESTVLTSNNRRELVNQYLFFQKNVFRSGGSKTRFIFFFPSCGC